MDITKFLEGTSFKIFPVIGEKSYILTYRELSSRMSFTNVDREVDMVFDSTVKLSCLDWSRNFRFP